MKYKIDIQRYDTNEIVETANISADDIDMAVKRYNDFVKKDNQPEMYYTLSDNDGKSILTSNENMRYVNSHPMAYICSPFGTVNIVDKETPSIYLAINEIPLSDGVNKLIEKLADDVDMCIIVASEQKDIRKNFDYIRENMPSVKQNNIFFLSDTEKDKTKYIKKHHHNPMGRYIENTESHAEISILLSSSEKDLADWSAKGGIALELVDENHKKTHETGFVDVSSSDDISINGACIGILHEYDNLMLETIKDKQLNVKYKPIIEGQLVPVENIENEFDDFDDEMEDLIDEHEEDFGFCFE